jgi:hypothetical protein
MIGIDTGFNLERQIIVDSISTGSVGLEIGVWRGEFSEFLYRSVSPKKMYGIDPWAFVPVKPDSWYGGFLAKSQEDMDRLYESTKKRLSILPDYTLIRDYSYNITDYVDPQSIDWVYIDGDHDYTAVSKDLLNSYTLIKPGGIITGDDCIQHPTNPIYKAVQKFLSSISYKNVAFHNKQYIIHI